MCPTITALEMERDGRVDISLEGDISFSLDPVLAATLYVGQYLTDAELGALRERDAAETAYNLALRYLSYRPRSEGEVRRHLQDKGVGNGAIEMAISRLRQVGLLNDAEFARLWVEGREAHRPRSRRMLHAELKQKGVEPEVAEAATASVDDEEAAWRVARKALPRYADLEWQVFYRRLLALLQRRGFAFGLSRKVVDSLWREIHPE